LYKSDQHIIEGLQKGEEKAFHALYQLHYRALCYFCDRMVKDKAEAEDIAEETFLKLLNKKKDFDNLRDIKSFLFTAARNACIDVLRKKKWKNIGDADLQFLSIADETAGEAEMIKAKVLQAIYAEVENLPGQCKRVFKSFFIDGKPTAVIAAEMGLKPQTVLNQKIKAIHLLRLTLLKDGILLVVLAALAKDW
jgi:RNA polymerase sigma-70 factor (family 1)